MLLFMVSIVVLFVVLQATGLWNWLDPLTRSLTTWPVVAEHVEMYRLGRDDWRVLQNEERRLAEWEAKLTGDAQQFATEQRALRTAQNELELERQRLAAWEADLAARQAVVERLEEEYEALQRLREVYEAMRPREAARILVDMTDAEVASLLVDMDPRTAAAILAEFPVDKAAVVSRLLGL